MAKARKRRKGETFETEVRRQFGSVSERFGLTDEEITGRLAVLGGVKYVRGGLAYRWNWDPREGYMWVRILLDLDDDRYRISLRRLVTNTQPKGDQILLDNCRSWLVLQRAVASHTLWVERLHPRLIALDAPNLILASGGERLVPAMPDAARHRRSVL
ncbi:hypothetical protein [Actinokineospora sp. UTMC 2448]|uniref:hypothetical protein n=1 Tax=Actinokineospora sp. UTMC 2448 TaxID=2268449 RepID=UPI00216420CB|nr:hypothetical protein [Actinokineospora sp. UTMC 2448]UVS78206.1 hypothetical protein Actkin_01930 [Actinokineospora sp. UTMC 2448]